MCATLSWANASMALRGEDAQNGSNYCIAGFSGSDKGSYGKGVFLGRLIF